MLRFLYRLLWRIALPVALLRLWWRGRKEPGYRQHVGERLGFYPSRANPDRPCLLVRRVPRSRSSMRCSRAFRTMPCCSRT